MSINKNLYNEDSIKSLDPLSFTRLRPQVYCGSTEYSTQLLIEILSNAVDEFRVGNGNEINITIDKNNYITVKDNGQGFIPNSVREEDGKTILEAAFSVLNTSGKYSEDGVYEGTALGLNGVGSKLTNFLSNMLMVHTHRDGKYEEVVFSEGKFKSREVGEWEDTKNPSGTTVRWHPSSEFFTNPEIDYPVFIKLCKVISCLCPGLLITFAREGHPTISFFSKNGLDDLVDEVTNGKELLARNRRFTVNFSNGKHKLDLVLTYTQNYSSNIVAYVNTGLTESGPHIAQIKTILTREFNKFFREKGWLKEKDDNLSGDDIQEGMCLVFNITAPNVAYDAQTKSRLTKIDMKPFIATITGELQVWLLANEKMVKGIAEKALNARKAREAARKARDAARNLKPKKEKVVKFSSKLADCSSKDRKKCELYIVEGDSASGNLKKARDNRYQAVLPIRGKMLNVYKASIDKVQKNAEIMTIIEALGLVINPKTMTVDYNPDKLRYGKIIIESDADVDGM